MSRVALAVDQIRLARQFVTQFIQDLDDDTWFWQPHEGVTHVAWQVGHLAGTQYRLALERRRGVRPDDESLISSDFLKRFGRGSVPDPNPKQTPTCEEIRDVFERVYRQTLAELAEFTDEEADQPVPPPEHPMFRTRLEAIRWSANHEFVHAGQIALLRRLSGKAPLR